MLIIKARPGDGALKRSDASLLQRVVIQGRIMEDQDSSSPGLPSQDTTHHIQQSIDHYLMRSEAS